MPGHVIDCSTNQSVFTFLSEFRDRSVGYVVGETVVLCLIFLIAAISNTAMIVLINRSKKPLAISNVFLVNLVVSELFFTLSLPLVITTRISVDWVLGDVLCKTVNYSAFVCGMSCLLTVAIISCDRYLCVRHSGKNRMSRRTSTIAIVIIWILAMTSSIPVAVYQRVLTINASEDGMENCDSSSSQINFERCPQKCRVRNYCGVSWPSHFNPSVYMVCIAIIFYILPVIFICVFYVRIWLTVTQSSKKLDGHSRKERSGGDGGDADVNAESRVQANPSQHFNRNKTMSRHQTRLAKMTLIIIGSFFFMWLPFFVISSITQTNREISSTGLVITLMFAYSNACVNPFIYGYFNPGFRQQFKNLFQTCGQRLQNKNHCRMKCCLAREVMDERAERTKPCATKSIKTYETGCKNDGLSRC